jgi:hypothetical protein
MTQQEILRRRKERGKFRRAAETKMAVCLDRYSKCVTGNYGFSAPSAKCGPTKNAQMALPGNTLIFAPTPSLTCQEKTSEVLWTYIAVMSFVFQCNL